MAGDVVTLSQTDCMQDLALPHVWQRQYATGTNNKFLYVREAAMELTNMMGFTPSPKATLSADA